MKVAHVSCLLLALLGLGQLVRPFAFGECISSTSIVDDPPAGKTAVASPLAKPPIACEKMTDDQLNKWITTLKEEHALYVGLGQKFTNDAQSMFRGMEPFESKLTDPEFRRFAATLFEKEVDWKVPKKPELLALTLIALQLLTDVQDSLDEAELVRLQRICPPVNPPKNPVTLNIRMESSKDCKDMDENQLKNWKDYLNFKLFQYANLSQAYSRAALVLANLKVEPAPIKKIALKPTSKLRDYFGEILKKPFDPSQHKPREFVEIGGNLAFVSLALLGPHREATQEGLNRVGLLHRDLNPPAK